MNIPVLIQLDPNESLLKELGRTIEIVTQATNYVSEVAWEQKVFHPSELHPIVYKKVRENYGLASQHVVRILGRVAAAYRLAEDYSSLIRFNGCNAIPYDERMITFSKKSVSILTTDKRVKTKFKDDPEIEWFLKYQQGESWLFEENNAFYLSVVGSLDLINTCNKWGGDILRFFR